MKLFHGTYEKVAPIIKIGEFAMSGNNVFDGLFASPERDIAASHGNTVFIYHVDDDKIAKSRDLDARLVITQPRERSSLAAIWSTLSAIGNGTCAVITFVACALLFFICISD